MAPFIDACPSLGPSYEKLESVVLVELRLATRNRRLALSYWYEVRVVFA